MPRPWERYLPEAEGKTASPSGVQRDLRIIRQIGTPAEPPKPHGKSPGRAKGEQPPLEADFWTLIGGEGTYEELLEICCEVGREKGKAMSAVIRPKNP